VRQQKDGLCFHHFRQKISIVNFRLEPILMRIKEKPNAILCPLIESIDKNTIAYYGNAGFETIY
jgi:hypothetical protein